MNPTPRPPPWIPLALSAVLGAAGCDEPGAGVRIDEASAARGPDGRGVVDVTVRAFERLGGHVGTYCVSAHFLRPEVDPLFLPTRARYFEALEFAERCEADLEDGDVRTFRFVSASTTLPPGAPVRVQARIERDIDVLDLRVP